MATIRKRTWQTNKGEKRLAWVLHYVDADGNQHRSQFPTKREADDERVRIEGELAAGVHVPDKKSITVLDAAKAFLADFDGLVDAGKRERSTFRGYKQHVHLHIAKFKIAKVKLSRLSGPDCTDFAHDLEIDRTDAMGKKVFATFRKIIKYSWGKGWIAGNPADAVSVRTAGARTQERSVFQIPDKPQLKSLLLAARRHDNTGHTEALVCVLMFGGLRASELRGLRNADILLDRAEASIAQRADRWQQLGPVKTKNARRTVPLPPLAVTALRRWRLACPASNNDLAFPNGAGNVESYANIYNRLWRPLMAAAGLADIERSSDGKSEKIKPWFGLHALRHVACSLWIEQGAKPKRVMTWAGHASIQFTMDTYGHLWTDPESDQAIAQAIESSIVNS